MTKKTFLWAVIPAVVVALAVVGLRQAAAQSAKAGPNARPKSTTTPATPPASPQPASTRARVLEVDLYPVAIDVSRTEEGGVYYVRVSYQCRSNVPLRIAPAVRVRDVTSVTPVVSTQPLGPCASGRTGEFRCYGAGSFEAILDPLNVVRETNEANNVCRFDRASFAAGSRHDCSERARP